MKMKTVLLASALAAFAANPLMSFAADNVSTAKDAQTTEHASASNMFGGAIYDGQPALDVTAALVKAGGGADDFDFATALVSMLGEDTVNGEVKKLTDQYGEDQVNTFVNGMTSTVQLALKLATEQGISLPAPADLEGVDLAKALVKAGVTPDGTFWSGHMFDMAISHDLHNDVMNAVNADPDAGFEADKTVHKILNQAMYDVAQALGEKDVKLADLH